MSEHTPPHDEDRSENRDSHAVDQTSAEVDDVPQFRAYDAQTSTQSGETEYSDRQQSQRHRCPECGAQGYVSEDNETVCPECQTVIDNQRVSRDRARTFDHADWRNKRRTGGRVTEEYADDGIGGSAPWYLFNRNWQTGKSSADSRLEYALGEIRRMAEHFEVGRAERRSAAKLYRRAMKSDCITGRNIDAFTPACLLIAIRQSTKSIPVSRAELEPVSRASKSDIRLARSALERELNLKVPPLKPQDFLPRVTSEFDLPYEVEKTMSELLEAANKQGELDYHAYSPRTLIGAVAHLSCELEEVDGPTLDELEEELDVSKSTISQRKNIVRPSA